jgi:hypothetical protein
MEDDKLQFLLQWQQEASKVCRRALSLQRRSAAAPQRRTPEFALPRAAHTSRRSRPPPCEPPHPPRAAAVTWLLRCRRRPRSPALSLATSLQSPAPSRSARQRSPPARLPGAARGAGQRARDAGHRARGTGRGAWGAGRVTRGAGQVDEKTRIRELEEALERQLEETRALKRKLSQPVALAGGEPASPRAACGPEAGPTALAGGEEVSPPAARRESASWRSGARSPGGHSGSGGDLHSRESASMRARSNRVTPYDPPDLEQGLGPHRAEEGGEGGARRALAGGGRSSARDITRESSRESGGPQGGHLPHRFSKNSAKLAAEISASVTPRGAGPAGPLGRKADVAPGLQSLGQVAKSATAAQKAVDR